jgi:P27 family predicted phage terminase small subunit
VLKLARGNPGKRPINTEEPQLPAADTDPPDDLTGLAREEWMQLGPYLVEAGILTVGDVSLFKTYCRLVDEEDRYQKLITKHGDEPSQLLGYPSFLLKIRAQKKQYMDPLGLTPASRSQIKARRPKDAADERRKRFLGKPA